MFKRRDRNEVVAPVTERYRSPFQNVEIIFDDDDFASSRGSMFPVFLVSDRFTVFHSSEHSIFELEHAESGRHRASVSPAGVDYNF